MLQRCLCSPFVGRSWPLAILAPSTVSYDMATVPRAGRIRVENKTWGDRLVLPMESDPSIGMRVHHYARRARPASFAAGTPSSGPSLDVLPFAPSSSPELAILDGPPGSDGSANAPSTRRPDTPVPSHGTLMGDSIERERRQINPTPRSQPAKEATAATVRTGASSAREGTSAPHPEGLSVVSLFRPR